MAHLSARHEEAKRRRDVQNTERALALAMRTGYPIDLQAKPRTAQAAKQSSHTDTVPVPVPSSRCAQRVSVARVKQISVRRKQAEVESERQARNQQAAAEAPAMAAHRLRERKERERHIQEANINFLISQQPSSIEAMNIARMLSPRFQERVVFTPSITKNSHEEERIKELLMSTRVGSYYH
ncbi:TPA: hypothetical protein N0F65_011807 [Lagenidium giganteum]|uniref:Uncharacterized protein n=1 Tax=Lagenidium giganteum TaxID=4803 RepID=A0AAV2YT92_9STRA|nr:TPA: hypothetical protein N0F65_011807 [Lagenidium giganteum]